MSYTEQLDKKEVDESIASLAESLKQLICEHDFTMCESKQMPDISTYLKGPKLPHNYGVKVTVISSDEYQTTFEVEIPNYR
jgi:hypothetical protein